ncbi:winged helix-turn-helix domain-containing protein [Gallaecimonas sp. GXIMD4217]|uniref:winged helix-turn-helix domain-containing protein n=1 Tax=Gallaecimonas sp. GXIMD4217 TaxID=3131927 RepID=UPI00311AF0B0
MRYHFNNFTLDCEQLSLTLADHCLTLDARMARLLTLLIEAYPDHLGQRQLLEQIWPDTVVSNWSISRLVSDTRKLFQEHGIDEPVIQTLHGRGYRLAPELRAQLKASPGEATPDVGHNRRPYRLLAAAALLAVLAGSAYQWATKGKDASQLVIGEAGDTKGRILWVDDHPQNNGQERQFLAQRRIAVYTTASTEEALILLSMYSYDAVISDMGRNGDNLAGLKLLKTMRARGDDTPFFLYTILPSSAQTQLVASHGGQGVAVKSQALYEQLLPLFQEQ